MNLRFDRIYFSHRSRLSGEVPVFRDLSLEVKSGECVGIIGPEGGGKSTLLMLAAGLYRPDGGTIEVWKEGGKRSVPQDFRSNIGITFQMPEWQFLHGTVREELEEASQPRQHRLQGEHQPQPDPQARDGQLQHHRQIHQPRPQLNVHPKQQRPQQQLRSQQHPPPARYSPDSPAADPSDYRSQDTDAPVRTPPALAALESVGLSPPEFLERSPFTLSMGEARRLVLAFLLLQKPWLVLLDEPTAGLDAGGVRHVVQRIRDLKMQGSTVLLVSHDLDMIAGLVSRVLLLSGGNILADGPAEKLLADRPTLGSAGFDPPAIVRLAEKARQLGAPLAPGIPSPETLRTFFSAQKTAPRSG